MQFGASGGQTGIGPPPSVSCRGITTAVSMRVTAKRKSFFTVHFLLENVHSDGLSEAASTVKNVDGLTNYEFVISR